MSENQRMKPENTKEIGHYGEFLNDRSGSLELLTLERKHRVIPLYITDKGERESRGGQRKRERKLT